MVGVSQKGIVVCKGYGGEGSGISKVDEVEDRPNVRCEKCQVGDNGVDHTPPHGPRIRRASWRSRCIIVTRFAWIAQRFLTGFRQILKGSTRFSWGMLKLTHLRIDERGRLPLLLEERGWPNSATVIRLLCSRSRESSCLVRLLEPTKRLQVTARQIRTPSLLCERGLDAYKS